MKTSLATAEAPQAGFAARPLRAADVPRIMPTERAAYSVPWTEGNFIDSIAVGYPSELLEALDGRLIGYWLAMPGVDEMHLLNITVAPEFQRQGWALRMLDHVVDCMRAQQLNQLWLEVRVSNTRAQDVYRRYGFTQVGRRPAYYPAAGGGREDALLMSLELPA
jgi:ribosomal-protein-alanine N-acetyltransferase